MPGHVLWETSVEKGEQLQVSQIMLPGEDVSHGICFAFDVRDFMIVVIVVVMQAREVAQVGSGLVQGNGTLVILGDCCNIVV